MPSEARSDADRPRIQREPDTSNAKKTATSGSGPERDATEADDTVGPRPTGITPLGNEVLFAAYAPVWAREASCAFAEQLFERFKQLYHVAGEDARKSVPFFVHAMRDAGITQGAFRTSTRAKPRAGKLVKKPDVRRSRKRCLNACRPSTSTRAMHSSAWLSLLKQLLERAQ